MLSGFYSAASGMMMQQRVLNVLTNNFANVKTPGFRAERVVSTTFDQEFLTRIENGGKQFVGTGSAIRVLEDVPTEFDISSLEETRRPFDIAINGEGFFNIMVQPPEPVEGEAPPEQTEPMQMMTRNGNFDIDEEGFLILRGMGRVLGQKGELQVNGSDFTVAPTGEVYDNQGKLVDQMMITLPGEDVEMAKYGNGLFTVPDPDENVPIASGLVQGTLERSNVNPTREMSLAMEAQRAFQSCSNALKIIDTMNQKSATQIASL